MTLLQDLSLLNEEQLSRFLDRADEALLKGAMAQVHAEIALRCSAEGQYFLRFVKTRDEADPDHAIKPFPLHLDYTREIWESFSTSNRIIIAKSRQMMMSWIACAYCIWWARFKPNQAVFWQSRKDDDANSMVALPGLSFGRCQFLENHLPNFLQQAIKCSEGKIVYPNGSFIQALAGGADQIRGRVFSLLIEDEFAHQEEQGGVYTAIAPLIQKGSKIILISTPNGSDNVFAKLWFGHESDRRSE